MVKEGRKYEFYFGNSIYIPYMVFDIEKVGTEKDDWILTLVTADDYAGCNRVMYIKYRYLGNKRKIYEWVERG